VDQPGNTDTTALVKTRRTSVYNYRTEHPTDTSTLASLIAADKVYLADAIDNTHVSLWIDKRGTTQKLHAKILNCVGGA